MSEQTYAGINRFFFSQRFRVTDAEKNAGKKRLSSYNNINRRLRILYIISYPPVLHDAYYLLRLRYCMIIYEIKIYYHIAR